MAGAIAGRTISQALVAKLGADLSGFQRGLRRAKRMADSEGRAIGRVFGRVTRTIRTVATAVGVVTAAVTGLGVLAVREFVQWERALTGVAKTVDATTAQIRALGQDFIRLSEQIPVASTELARIGELAGQLGIQVSNILDFTKVIAALGVSTNLATEEAATSLARLTNIMGTAQDKFDELGSTIVDLGNNLATTEAEIVQFGLRIAGAGKIAGLTEAQVLGIGAAMSSVGIGAELGGTAVQKAIIAINTAVASGAEEVRSFAGVARLGAEEFATLWRQDAAEAFTLFVEGLAKSGDRAAKVLDDLGLGNERTVRAFLSVSNAGDLLRRSVSLASTAWRENTALTEEATRFYDRLGARLEALRNKIENVAAELGEALAPVVERVTGLISGFLDRVRQAAPAIREFAQTAAQQLPRLIEGTVQAIGRLAERLVSVVDFFRNFPLAGEFGVVGLVFLGPSGAAAFTAIGAVIDSLFQKFAGPQTVTDALRKQANEIQVFLERARQSADRMGDAATSAIVAAGPREFRGMTLPEAIEMADEKLKSTLRTLGRLQSEGPQGFDLLIQKARDFTEAMQNFRIDSFMGGVGGGVGAPEGAQPADPFSPQVGLANSMAQAQEQQIQHVNRLIKGQERSLSLSDRLKFSLVGVADTIGNQIVGGIAQIVTGFGSVLDVIKQVGAAILREIVGALVQAIIKATIMKAIMSAFGLGAGSPIGTFVPPPFRLGGIVPRAQTGLLLPRTPTPGFGGGIPVIAHPGEAIITRRGVRDMGMGGVEDINRGRGAQGGGELTLRVDVGAQHIPEPTDFGIIATKPQVQRLFMQVLRNMSANGFRLEGGR